MGSNAEASRVFATGLKTPADLSDHELVQFNLLMSSVIRHYENIHFQYASGAIDEHLWQGWSRRLLGVFDGPGARGWWASQKTAFSSEFQAFVDSAIDSAPGTEQFFTGFTDPRTDVSIDSAGDAR